MPVRPAFAPTAFWCVYDAFAKKLAERVSTLKAGPGTEAGVTIGPMIEEKGAAMVEAHIADALAKGASLISGGKRLGGLMIEPGVLTGVTADMAVAQEETFGPPSAAFRL